MQVRVIAVGGGGGGSREFGYAGPNICNSGGGSGYVSIRTVSVNAGTSYPVTIGDGGRAEENGETSSFGSLVEANGGLGVDGNTGGNEAWDLAWDLVGAASRKAAQVEIMVLLAITGMASVKGTTRHSVCAIH